MITSPGGRAVKRADNHRDCLMCGGRDPLSLRLRFTDMEDGTMTALFEAHPALQGYDGVLHGGVIGALLDAVMTHLLLHREIPAMTAELGIRYLRPVPCDGTMFLSARMEQERPPLYRLSAELRVGDTVHATAEATFICRSGTTVSG